MMRAVLAASAFPLALTAFASAKPARWTFDLSPRLALWRNGGVEALARIAPLKGLVSCPAIRIEWGDGSASAHAADCEENALAESMVFRHHFSWPGSFVVAVMVEETGHTVRMERTMEIVE